MALNPYLEKRFYSLPPGWGSLSVTSRDLKLLGQLRERGSSVDEGGLFRIVTAYARHNVEGVRELEIANDEVSRTLLSDTSTTNLEMRTFSPEASMSLFAIKHSCAVQPTAADAIEGTLRRIFPKQSWVLANLTYPLIYRFVAQPTPGGLEQFLSYLFPLAAQATERALLLHLLHEDAIDRTNLAFQVYVGMLAHPYDACQVLLAHVERDLATGVALSGHRGEFLQFAAEELGSRRAADLIAVTTETLGASPQLSSDPLRIRFDLSAPEADNLSGLLSADASGVKTVNDSPMSILAKMRRAPYPEKVDFTRVTAIQSNWSFTDGGRQLMAMLRSLYMVDRTDTSIERAAFLSLLGSTRSVSDYMLAGPSCIEAARSLETVGCAFDPPVAVIEANANLAVPLFAGTDRTWIHQLQWKLRGLREQARIRAWIQTIRDEAEYRSSFLSGVDWSFVDEVIAQNLLDDLMSYDGAYALLLMETESPNDPTRLDTVLELLLEGKDAAGAVEALIDEYGELAPLFVRRFLTPANLRFNRMASDHLSALDQLVKALEQCLRRTGFGQLSEEAYRAETKTMTSELLLANLNTGKFEIPWANFRRDASERFQDLYDVYISLLGALRENKVLSELAYSPAQFPNGRKEEYRVKAVDTPLFQIVIGLIADFFEHNAFGLEVILSGRFRHKNLPQEMWAALPHSKRVRFQNMPAPLQDAIVSAYRPVLEKTLDEWSDARVQTVRQDRPDGLFDLVPTQAQLDQLLERTKAATSLDGIIDVVIEWLQDQLRAQLSLAGDTFVEEVTARLTAAFDMVRQLDDETTDATEEEKLQVHLAVCEEAERKIHDLKGWFSGVDAATSDVVNLLDLTIATAELLGSVSDATNLTVSVSSEAACVRFEPADLKIAFDMVREVLYNAARHSGTAHTRVSVKRLRSQEALTFAFSNRTLKSVAQEKRQTFSEKAYESVLAAIATEGNSGHRKIAASCSTLLGRQTDVTIIRRSNFHHIVIRFPEPRHE